MEEIEFESIQIGIASPDQIRSWSHGEVKKPETINYRTLKPERDGLFCERIFGPTKDWECHCGKYKRIRYKGQICPTCGVEITSAKVRRERMGSIELAAPVSHIWYYKTIPSKMGIVLGISPKDLEGVLYFTKYIVLNPGQSDKKKKDIISEDECKNLCETYFADPDFKVGMGAEAIKELLEEIDLDKECADVRAEIDAMAGSSANQKRAKAQKRLEILEAFRKSGNRPEWMILEVLPVIPPDLRPMVQLDGGRFATSDLNDLYRRVINRNNRLKKLLELNAPDIIIRNEKRMLQEAVDALIDNGRHGKTVTGPNNRALKSLSDMLKGKQGRFRQNLLGKRVDYSGRSVIVVGPELKMYQCGLPKEMALELFKPFVMKRLVETEVVKSIKNARKMVERSETQVWDALEVVIKEHPVLLNRAPTLHRLGIQAFEPVLVEGRALKLHPLACTAYNADFDGDQMAIHVPLSAEAQAEARFLMLAANNLLKPADGKPVTVPTQDMVLGSYYLTIVKADEPGANKVFRDKSEAIMAYSDGVVGLHAPIKVRVSGKDAEGNEISSLIHATVGAIIFNESIPQDLDLPKISPDRKDPKHALDLEICFKVKDDSLPIAQQIITSNDQIIQQKVSKKTLGKIIDACIRKHGTTVTATVLDKIKATGFKYSTRGAITVSVADAIIPDEKAVLIKEAEEKVDKINMNYRMGYSTEEDRLRDFVKVWNDATEEIGDKLKDNLDEFNPIYMMADSGARGSMSQIRQLAGMRGLIANTAGKIIEVPIRANYREGLNVLEYFISSRGARKGLADTALRTADSGYLTRRLVDVSQEVIIREDDCGTDEGLLVYEITEGKQIIEPLEDRLIGRYLLNNLEDHKTGEILVDCDHIVGDKDAAIIRKELESRVEDGLLARPEIRIRSILTCKSDHGVCVKCYGSNLATGNPVTSGEAVGIIAAQSIGEPGTQLTMRTFHTGGIASTEDITQGLPRVEELFEARRPKKSAIISEIDGTVNVGEDRKITVTNTETGDFATYKPAFNYRITVQDGATVKKGDALTEGSVYPQDILAVLGAGAVEEYIIKEIQSVYRLQGVDINDKHIEVIVRQMMRKLKVVDGGNTKLISNASYDKEDVMAANAAIAARVAAGETELKEATYVQTLLGITKASLATESFLSAASFQETTRVLTEAAIRGKTDPLFGLKENVIIGKLVPAGTGSRFNYVHDASSVCDEDDCDCCHCHEEN